MIEAIGMGTVAIALRDPRSRQQRRPTMQSRAVHGEGERVEIDEALAAVARGGDAFDAIDRGDEAPERPAPADGPTVTAIAVARRLAADAPRAVAAQARLGPAAVWRLVGTDG